MDLHCHTTASDGRLSPTSLVELAVERGLSLLAITDHDTLDGLDEAQAACPPSLRLVPGVELSTHHEGRGLHLLAYFEFMGSWSPAFKATLDERQASRDRRLQAIAGHLDRCGVPVDAEQIRADARGAVTRAHIARALVAAGHVPTVQEAFDRWIGDARPAFVPHDPWPTKDAIAAVVQAGGICGVAHSMSDGFGDPAIAELHGQGMHGVEIVHPSHRRQTRKRLRKLAGRLGLVTLGGSDFHGWPGSSLLPGGQIPESWRDRFTTALAAAGKAGQGAAATPD